MRVNKTDKQQYINVSVELTKEFNQTVKDKAKTARMSKSEFIRRALEAYMEN